MVEHLYPHFMTSDDEYRQSENFWWTLLDSIAERLGQAREWRPWETRTFLDGTPTPKDGNPIVDARSSSIGRAIRIIQHPPQHDAVELAAWLDKFDFSAAGGPGPTDELVLNLSLSTDTAEIARKLLESWMDANVSKERMEGIIAQLERKSG